LLSQRLTNDAAQSALSTCTHCTAFQSGTSAPVWLDTAAARPALPGRQPGLQKTKIFKEILKVFKVF